MTASDERHVLLRGHALGMTAKDLDELARATGELVRTHVEESAELRYRSLKSIRETIQAWRRSDATRRATFRFKQSAALARLFHAEPKAILRTTIGDLPPEYRFEWIPLASGGPLRPVETG